MNLAGSPVTVIPFPFDRRNDRSDHDLTLVIPAYNEESRLPKTLSDAKAFLESWGINYRVVVVDDGSHDTTPTVAEGFGPRFSTISQVNGGKGSAVRRGILASRGCVVAFTDADLPFDLSALKTAYQIIRDERRQVIFGSRAMAGSKSKVERRWSRMIASATFRFLMRFLVSNQIADTQCGLKVFSQNAARRIFSQTTVDGFAFDAEVVYLTHFLGLTFEAIPVTLVNDYSTTISLSRNAIPMLMDVLRVRVRSFFGQYQNRDLEVADATETVPVQKAA